MLHLTFGHAFYMPLPWNTKKIKHNIQQSTSTNVLYTNSDTEIRQLWFYPQEVSHTKKHRQPIPQKPWQLVKLEGNIKTVYEMQKNTLCTMWRHKVDTGEYLEIPYATYTNGGGHNEMRERALYKKLWDQGYRHSAMMYR